MAITVEAAAVNAARVAWTGYDTSSLLGFAGFHVYLQESDFSTVTGLTPVASLGPNVRETRLDNLDRSKTYFIAVVGYNRNNEFNAIVTTRTWSDPFAGNITSNLTIGGAEPSTIDIFQSINVANNATLTVTPGTTLRFARGTGLTVEQGKLVANGTALDPIVFTSAQDVAGGSPAAGDWNGIALGTGGAASSLQHVFVKFGKGLSIAGGSPTLAAFTARNNSGAGLTLSGGATVTTADGLFLFNEAGILQTENARLTISNSVLKNNAIDARNSGGSQLVARQNWWGTLDAIEIATRVNGDVDTAGFLDYEPLLTPAIGIVGGSLNVGNRNVALRFACRTAAEMRVSENSAFVNAFFGPFATPQNFLLSEGGGEKTVYAQFRSITGRASTPVSLTLNYITDGPVIRAFNLSEGQTLPRPFTVTGNATAILGMAAIEFYVDDILQQSIAGGSYSHLLDVRTFSSGIHRVKLLARDNSGNIATLERNVFFNVTPPPAPVITTPADNLIVANNRLDVAGTAEAGIVLRITRNGTPVGNTTADANGNFGVTGISLVEGQNLIVAVASDSVGSSSSAPRSVVLDSGAPARLIMDAPVYRPGLGLDVTWHYPADGERATRFQLYWHTASFNDPAQATGQSVVLANMDYGVRGLANTTYYFGVVGLDDAGNRSPLSELISFDYDDTAPVLTLAFDKPQPVGLGQLRMTLTANEALAAKPILAFQPEGAPAPIAVPLTEVALNTYEGTYNIHQFVPSGRAEFRASARDLAGNSVNRKPVNGDLLIDVQPPVGEIATAPLGPVQTVNPVNVAVNLTLTEAAKVGTSPTLSFRPPTGEAVAIALTGEGTVWNGTLALAPTMGSGFGQFVLSVRDALDNVGTQITTGAQLEIYNTDLPSPPSTPSGLQATTLPGGQIRLHWEAVENAEIYRLYREPAPANAPATLVADNIANAEYVDLPPADGDFVYAISASRRGAESAKSSPVPGRSDRTPPSAPTNVEAQLVASGVQISWEQPAGGEAPTKFNIYRNDQLVKSVSRVAPVIDVPPRGIMNYVVASVDAAGNENRSTAATIQMLVGAVNNLQVLVNIGQAPSLTWASGDPTTTGYNVYRNGIKQNAAPLTATSFTDALPLGGDVVQYAVRAVNAAGEESSSRTVNVYSVDLSLLANNAGGEVSGSLISSYFDNFAAKVSNLTPNSTLPLREIELRRTISSGEALTRTLGVDADIGSGNWLTRQVVFPGAKILAAQSVRFRAIQETDIGGSSVIYQDVFDFTDVANPGVMIEITANQLPLAGGLTPFDVRIFNRGFADLDFLVTSNRGTDHGDLYVSVKDAQGQEVSRAYFQGTPPGTRFTADGRGYLSVAPGSSVRLTVPDVLVPESLAVNSAVTFQAAIDQIYYKLGSNEQLVSGPLRGEMRSALSQTPYFGTAQTDLTSYPNDTPIIITGQAINRATSQPVPNAPLKIGFSTRGFNWDQPITTDENGNYRYEYRPPQGLSGSLTIWAAHPDVFDVLNQARIEIFRIYASPARGDIRMSKNDSFTFRISLINPGDRELTQFAVTSTAYRMDGQNRVPVNNVVGGANLPEGFVVRPGETRSIDLTLTAAADAPDNAVVEFTLTSAEGASAMFTATVTLLPAVPVLAVTDPPLGYLEVSVDRGGFISRQITVVNRGLKDLEGVELVPPAQVPWIVPNLAKSADGKIHLPDIRIGESYSFTVVFAPPAETPLGQASDFLIIKGANAQAEFRINIFPLVTSDKKGAVQFYVDDVLGLPVPDATIRLRNTALQVELPAVKTDQDGYVTVREMQEGNWSWLITAPGHSSAVGIVEVIPGQTVQVGVPKTRLNKSLVTVTFRVEPVPFTDRYEIKIEQTFETHVPAPVLVLTPPVLEFRDVLPGFEANFVVKAKNHGLIEMTDVTITGTDAPSGRLEPLINYFPVLRAQEEVEVPFRLVYTGTPSGPQGLMARQGPGGFPVGCGGGDLPSLADAIAGMNALFKGGYICAASDAAKLAVAQGLLITLYLWQTQVNKVYKYAYKLATVLTCLGIFSGDGGGGGGGGGGSGPSNGTVGNFGMSGPVCFAAGTPVLMADGTTKPIEQITTNDWICTGQAKGAVANVVETFATTTDKVREVKFRIEDGSGAERSLQTTDDHLFWVDGKGWTLASEVQPGAWLTTEKGQRATVLANAPLGKSLKVYTFKAREDHAFYAHGVLVHDMCGEWQPQPAGLNQVTSR
ncbi:MAG: polymorphic toxin-type HINT domain-containing protein [Verrucomicrobiota bacterium]